MTPWLFWIIGAALVLTGLTLTLRALFADRARGRKRCPRCWYDMSGAGEPSGPLTCPECGRAIKNHRRLRKTRRHWIAAALACIVVAIGASVALVPRLAAGSPVEILPRSALLLSYDLLDTQRQDQASTRLAEEIDDMWPWQRERLARLYVERFAAGRAARYTASGKPIAPSAPAGPPPLPSGRAFRPEPTAPLAIDLHEMTRGHDGLLKALNPDTAGAIDALFTLLETPDLPEAARIATLSLLARIASGDARLGAAVTEILAEAPVETAAIALLIGDELGISRELVSALENRATDERDLIVRLTDRQTYDRARWNYWNSAGPLEARRRLALAAFESPASRKPPAPAGLPPEIEQWLLERVFSGDLRRPDRVLEALRRGVPGNVTYCGMLLQCRGGRVVAGGEEAWAAVLMIASSQSLEDLFLYLRNCPTGAAFELREQILVRVQTPQSRRWMLRRLAEEQQLWPTLAASLEHLIREGADRDVRLMAAQLATRLESTRLLRALEHVAERDDDVLMRVAAGTSADQLRAALASEPPP